MKKHLMRGIWRVWRLEYGALGPESNIAQKAQKDFYCLLMAMDDQIKIDFFEYLETVKEQLDSWG